MTTTDRDKTQEEFMDTLRQLSTENKKKVLRLLVHMAAPDGFSEAYTAFITQRGGLEAVGIDAVDRFMDEWEKSR